MVDLHYLLRHDRRASNYRIISISNHRLGLSTEIRITHGKLNGIKIAVPWTMDFEKICGYAKSLLDRTSVIWAKSDREGSKNQLLTTRKGVVRRAEEPSPQLWGMESAAECS